ncbi:hypothetical protein BC940DRAFT_1919 [Gongronella butleri]|nr:hypothetical protein BC940DRAFT_1919 [Gongronella butleri]
MAPYPPTRTQATARMSHSRAPSSPSSKRLPIALNLTFMAKLSPIPLRHARNRAPRPLTSSTSAHHPQTWAPARRQAPFITIPRLPPHLFSYSTDSQRNGQRASAAAIPSCRMIPHLHAAADLFFFFTPPFIESFSFFFFLFYFSHSLAQGFPPAPPCHLLFFIFCPHVSLLLH